MAKQSHFRFRNLAFLGMSVCALMLAAAPARADFSSGLIDVDFNGNANQSPTQSGAAAIGSAGDQWNGIDAYPFGNKNASPSSSTPLIASTGAASGVTLDTYNSSDYAYSVDLDFSSTPYNNLMTDGTFILNSGSPLVLTVSGLTAGQSYSLDLYADDSNTGSTTFAINGDTQTVNYQAGLSSLIQGEDYAFFSSEAAASDGTLTISITGTDSNSFNGVINGLQLEALAPTPSGGAAAPLPKAPFAGLLGGLVALLAIGHKSKRVRLRVGWAPTDFGR